MSSSGSGSKSRRLSVKGMGTKVATMMLGQDGTKALAPSGAATRGPGVRPRPRRVGPGGAVATGRVADQGAHQPGVLLSAPDHQDEQRGRGDRRCGQATLRLLGDPHRGVAGGRRAPVGGRAALLAARRHEPRSLRRGRADLRAVLGHRGQGARRHQRHQRNPDPGICDQRAGDDPQGFDQAGGSRVQARPRLCCTPPTSRASSWH